MRCTIDALNRPGGAPIVTNGHKRKHQKIQSFEKDSGIDIKLCKTRSPQTKGKDKSANRFINRLKAYDYEIDDESHLIELLDKLTVIVNQTNNQTTQIPPLKLFEKEKEYFSPLPPRMLIENYLDTSFTATVPPTLLINYKGCGYSVPARYIGRKVKAYVIDNKLYIYSNTELINVHNLSEKKINYNPKDYKEGLSQVITSKDEKEFDKIAQDNLKLDKMRENVDEYIDMLNDGRLSFVDALYELTEKELQLKEQRTMNACVKIANFPYLKSFDDFDFGFQPSINKEKILDFKNLRFMEAHENILFIGTPGVGKTHLATSIGIEAAK